MMITDADTHLTPTGAGLSVDELLAAMDRAEVDRALAWLRPDYCGTEIEAHNAYIYQATRAHPDRILGFGWADPTVGVGHAREMVRRCVYDYGLHGVKLNGAQNHYFIDDSSLVLPVVEEIAQTGKPLALHVGPDAYEQTHPYRAARIADRYPEMPILIVHMGMRNWPMNRAAIEIAEKHPNMILIGSAALYTSVLSAIHALGPERVCFGSDAPFNLMHVELAAYEALLEGELGGVGRAAVLGGNVARLFGLPG
jgi:predicted TIM-barrel fold metal-dependent hydrolase